MYFCYAQLSGIHKKVKNICAGVSKTTELYFYSLSNVKNFSANNSIIRMNNRWFILQFVDLVHSFAAIYKQISRI